MENELSIPADSLIIRGLLISASHQSVFHSDALKHMQKNKNKKDDQRQLIAWPVEESPFAMHSVVPGLLFNFF